MDEPDLKRSTSLCLSLELRRRSDNQDAQQHGGRSTGSRKALPSFSCATLLLRYVCLHHGDVRSTNGSSTDGVPTACLYKKNMQRTYAGDSWNL